MSQTPTVPGARANSAFLLLAASVLLGACASDTGGVSPLAVRELTLHAPKTSIEVGEPFMMSLTVRDGRDSLVSSAGVVWSAAPTAIATVADGVVTAHAPGTVVITAAIGQVASRVTLDVRPARAVALSVSATQTQLAPQQTTTIVAETRDARNATIVGAKVAWRSTDSRVLTVTEQGVVTGLATGVAYVVASADNVRDSLSLTVSAPSALILAPDDIDVGVNAQRVLAPRFLNDNGVVSEATGVTWSSSNAQIATAVNGTVIGIAPGIATVTATVGALSATATVRVAQVYGDYVSTTLLTGVQGVIRADNIAIHQLIASGPLTLIATGDFAITGFVQATCYPLTIIVGGRLITNTYVYINNNCSLPGFAPPSPAPPLRIVANSFAVAAFLRVTSTGDVSVTNDPTLIAVDFSSDRVDRSTDRCSFRDLTIEQLYPSSVPAGATSLNGPHIDLTCRGTMRLQGNFITRGGTNAGSITQLSRAVGGTGGNSGTIRIRTTGDFVVNGILTFTVPASGHGGDATATVVGNTGGTASAVGGNGGDIGSATRPPVEILVAGTVAHLPTGQGPMSDFMRITIGSAGHGGTARAIGGQGVNGTLLSPAGVGGTATAVGGKGGRTFPLVLPAPTTFDINTIKRIGFGSGNGGNAIAAGGPGGNGSAEYPNGGPGGTAIAFGGNGSVVPFGVNVAFPRGGDAGFAQLSGGIGGRGFDRCDPIGVGGIGGAGGTVSGSPGLPGVGIGMQEGGYALLEIWGAGIGGAGGKGATPGAGGSKGADNTVNYGRRFVDALSFADGLAGKKCE